MVSGRLDVQLGLLSSVGKACRHHIKGCKEAGDYTVCNCTMDICKNVQRRYHFCSLYQKCLSSEKEKAKLTNCKQILFWILIYDT